MDLAAKWRCERCGRPSSRRRCGGRQSGAGWRRRTGAIGRSGGQATSVDGQLIGVLQIGGWAVVGYIGPGAGIALAGSVLAVFWATVAALLALVTWPVRLVWRWVRRGRALRRATFRRVVVIGLDGLEPALVERWIDEGLLPNLARLKREGSYRRLATTFPPLSPVAWSSFSTGTNPGKHNIFDFLVRRQSDYRPEMSSVRIEPARRMVRVGRWQFPLSAARVAGARRSRTFWQVLGEHGVFSAVIRVPISFPPDRFHGVQLSAMCVPDLLGSQGTYYWFVESEGAAAGGNGDRGDVTGRVVRVVRRGDRVVGELTGPPNPLRSDGRPLRVPIEIRGNGDESATLRIGRQRIVVQQNRWSDWVRVEFPAGWGVRVRGICRVLVKRLEPFAMYCSPVQIDPQRPVLPISHPWAYAPYLAHRFGPFATLGLAEDTEALADGVLDDDEFLEQVDQIHGEREQMLLDALSRIGRGVIVCVFDAPDRVQHMFWRWRDGDEAEAPASWQVVRRLYQRMDETVGRVLQRVDERTAVVVMSDHGFKSFRRCVDLNAWLRERGYLALRDGATASSRPYLADVDWSRTQAYAIGLAGIYINQQGREAQGIVRAGDEKRRLVERLCAELRELRDEQTGQRVIQDVVSREAAYRGPYVEHAPDLIVGYREGYRVSWGTAVGRCAERVLFDNERAWCGDHCIHPELVPGVLLSSVKLQADEARIIDLAPTVLEWMGVPVPSYMDGRSLWTAEGS